jgi:hypothetical protein
MTNINLLHVPAPGRRLQRVFMVRGIHDRHANLGMHRSSDDGVRYTLRLDEICSDCNNRDSCLYVCCL